MSQASSLLLSESDREKMSQLSTTALRPRRLAQYDLSLMQSSGRRDSLKHDNCISDTRQAVLSAIIAEGDFSSMGG